MADVALNLVVLRSADLHRAERFYRLLGIQFVREQHGTGPEHLACYLGEAVLEIYPRTAATEGPEARIGFGVPSVVNVVKAVLESGERVLSPAKKGRWGLRAVVVDPDGHRVELIEKKVDR